MPRIGAKNAQDAATGVRTQASGRTSRGDVQPDEPWQPSVGDTGHECVVDAITSADAQAFFADAGFPITVQ